jgi:hypothetical protein
VRVPACTALVMSCHVMSKCVKRCAKRPCMRKYMIHACMCKTMRPTRWLELVRARIHTHRMPSQKHTGRETEAKETCSPRCKANGSAEPMEPGDDVAMGLRSSLGTLRGLLMLPPSSSSLCSSSPHSPALADVEGLRGKDSPRVGGHGMVERTASWRSVLLSGAGAGKVSRRPRTCEHGNR